MKEYRRPRPSPFLRTILLSLLILSGCSALTYYPTKMRVSVQDFESGDLEASYKKVEKDFNSSLNKVLYLLEGGMILHCQGNLVESNNILSEANAIIRQHQEKAVISLSKGSAQIGSLIVNEKTLPYVGEPYERVILKTLKAMNYLFQHETEAARVEIRRSFAVQEQNRRLHQKELDRVEEEAKKKEINSSRLIREVQVHYQDQHKIVSRAKNLYEDPFAYYLSALVYEFNGEYNDAFIDLKRAQKIQAGVPCVQNDLLRMAKLSGLTDTLDPGIKALQSQPRFADRKKEGEVILFFECGMAPRKRQIKIPIPIHKVGIVSLAFPKYEVIPNRIKRAALSDSVGNLYGKTFLLTDIEAIAFRNLQDRMPVLILKQILRAAAKSAMAKSAGDELGEAGILLANIFNQVTEQADLRSWLTLPRNLQVARMPVPAGEHNMVLALQDGAGRSLQKKPFPLKIRAGEIIFLNARSGTKGLIDFHIY